MRALLISLVALSALHGANVMRIACGSAGGVDAAGNVWQADGAYATGGSAYTTAALSALDLPYRALRFTPGTMTYTLPAANGDYLLSLYFIENRTAASVPPVAVGQRKFSVSVGGVPVVTSLDLFAAAGSMHPYSVTNSVHVTMGKIVIAGMAEIGNALLSGIRVDSVDPPPFAPYLTGTSASVPNCPTAGLAFLYVSDTAKLYWCFAGSNWNPVSDLVLAPSIFPKLVALDECSGTGGSPIVWDCSGMFRAMIARENGSTMSLVGIDLVVSGGAYPPVSWVPIK